jgi:putative ABC transport system permease protein
VIDRHTAWFRRLLRILPADFQADFGREMERTFGAQRRDAAGRSGLLRLWVDTVIDLLRTAPREHIDQITQDVRYAARGMAARPAFTLVTALVFALGIGATAAVFSVVDASLLRPVPFPNADNLVAIREQTPESAQPWELSYVAYAELRREAKSFEQLAAVMRNGVVIGGPEPRVTDAALVSANLLDTLRARLLAGRAFTDREDAPGGAAVMMMGEALAIARFGAVESAVGGTLIIDDRPTTVVGVLPDSFRFPAADVEVWLPIGQLAGEPWMRNRAVHVALPVGRLRSGVSIESARAELIAWMDAVQAREPGADPQHRLVVRSLAEQISAPARPAVTALACAVLMLLVVTCSSVGLLLLTRAAGRSNEVAIRLSLGASRTRLTRQLLTESVCLAAAGAVFGVLAAQGLLAFLVRGLEDALPPLAVPSINSAALAAAAISAMLAAIAGGLAPAARALSFVRTTDSPLRSRQRLVIAQVAVSCVLVVLAALLTRSLDRLLRVDIGFNIDRILTMRVTPPTALYQKPGAMTRFYETASARLRALPGVASVAVVSRPPLQPGTIGDLTVEGQPRRVAPVATYRRVLPGYFRALGIPVIEGRDFTEHDGTAEAVTIVSGALARRFWPPGQALGKRIKVGPADSEPWMQVIGVVGDVRTGSLEGSADLTSYEPHPQRPWNGMFMMVRTAAEPTAMTDTVRRALREIEPQVLISDEATMTERLAESVATRRFNAIVVGAFAGTTLLLVALALYGVLASWVASRTREIGIRAAVGASSAALARGVMLEGLRPTFVGLVIGLIAGPIAASAARALLFEVGPGDPWSYAGATALIVGVVLASSWLPARRAARIDPSVALRAE